MILQEISHWKEKNQSEKIIEQIHDIAIDLSRSGEVINRRDLVDILNESDFDLKEGIYIKQLLKDAYHHKLSTNLIKESIANNFKENSGLDSIYSTERVFVEVKGLNFEENLSEEFNGKIKIIEANSNKLRNFDFEGALLPILNKADTLEPEKELSLTGKTKVKNSYKYAVSVKNAYGELINKYEEIKNINLNLISDFEFLRNELKIIQEDLRTLLIDLFGNRITSDEPDLFDFTSVEWNDFENTWKDLDTYFEKVNSTLKSFKTLHKQNMQSIINTGSSSFKGAFNNLNAMSKLGDLSAGDVKKELGTALITTAISGAINAGKSHIEASKTVAKIKSDVEDLKLGMHQDYTLLLNDILRIASIYTDLKDKLIPSIKVFTPKVLSLINTEIKPTYTAICSIGNIEELRKENSILIKESRLIDLELVDKKESIEFCESEKERLKEILKYSQKKYDYFMSIKPRKPHIILSVFTLGRSAARYNEVIKEWVAKCKPTTDTYDYNKFTLNQQDEIILELNNDIDLLKARQGEINSAVEVNSNSILETHKKTPLATEKLKSLLINVREISNAAKNVLEVKLDREITKA